MRRTDALLRRAAAVLMAALAAVLPLGPSAAAEPAATACPPVARPLDEAQVRRGLAQARDHGLLWRIERDGRRSWLFGTLHVARQAWMFPGPRLRAALDASDVVALELDLTDAATVLALQQALRQPESAPALPAPLQARLDAAAARACVGQALQGLRPEVQVTLLAGLSLRGDGLDPAWGLDGFLAGFGRGLGRRILALETPEGQAQALRVEDPQQARQAVEQALAQLEQGQAQATMRRLAQVWAQGRTEELARYAEWCGCVESEDDRAAMRRLLDARNGPMADRIEAEHAAGHRVFAAVGALHLIGPQGLPALMAARGFHVEPVSLAPAAPR